MLDKLCLKYEGWGLKLTPPPPQKGLPSKGLTLLGLNLDLSLMSLNKNPGLIFVGKYPREFLTMKKHSSLSLKRLWRFLAIKYF